MKLLFVTQKLHGQDAFAVWWAEAFLQRGYDVTVLCLEWIPDEVAVALGRSMDARITVQSLGKESGNGKIRQIVRFLGIIARMRADRVFIHMTPVWGLIGMPVWALLRPTPVYLWYTHYRRQAGLTALRFYGKRLFCATAQSMPHLNHSPKKVVTGHGIAMDFWKKRDNHCSDPRHLLVVHRLSASKRLEIVLEAVRLLEDCTLDIYGMDAEPEYAEAMRALAARLFPDGRVRFHGSAMLHTLPDIYASHRFILNMASETIDKTMLEAMTCGCYPITTLANARAIGLPAAPSDETPASLAQCVRDCVRQAPLHADELYALVRSRHSLQALVERMDTFIHSAT